MQQNAGAATWSAMEPLLSIRPIVVTSQVKLPLTHYCIASQIWDTYFDGKL